MAPSHGRPNTATILDAAPGSSATVFSPSLARKVALTARDWSYIDSWVASKFRGRNVPSFERNETTLQALLALATMNELADEDRHTLWLARADALQNPGSSALHVNHKTNSAQSALLRAIEVSLPAEGLGALESLTATALQRGKMEPDIPRLSIEFVQSQQFLHETKQTLARLGILRNAVQIETQRVNNMYHDLQTGNFETPSGLTKEIAQLHKDVKTTTSRLSRLWDRAISSTDVSLHAIDTTSIPSIDDLACEEGRYLSTLAEKRRLETELGAFAGLPSDLDMAKAELDMLSRGLQHIMSHRDATFEGLVERESPVRRH